MHKSLDTSSVIGQWRIPEHVYWCDYTDHIVIVDMVSGKYFALDTQGAPIWRSLVAGKTGGGVSFTVADSPSITNSCPALFALLIERKLIIKSSDDDIHRHRNPLVSKLVDIVLLTSRSTRTLQSLSWWKRLALFADAYIGLIAVDIALISLGYHGLFRKFSSVVHTSRSTLMRGDYVDSLYHIALSAFRWYRPNVHCMHKAFGIYTFLKRYGVPSELCLGVQAHPFASHTWAEYNECVLGDYQEMKHSFTVIARLS